MALHYPEMKLSCRTYVGHMNPPLRRPSSKVLRPITSVRCFSSPQAAAGVFSVASSASHLHTSTPWLMLPPEIDPTTNRKVDRFYSFTEKQVFKLDRKEILKVPEDARCFGSSCGWLGFIDPNDCSLYLSNPFRDSPLVRLPSIETLHHVLGIKRKPSSTIMDSFIVDPRMVDPYSFDDDLNYGGYYYRNPECLSGYIAQGLTLLSGDIFREKEDCIVFLHTKNSGLALCRVGSDDSWTMFDYTTPRGYTHIACPFNDGGEKLFYSMYSDFMTEYWDLPYSYSYDDFKVIHFWEVLKPEKGAPNMRGVLVGAQRNRWNNGIKFETSENQYLKKLWHSCTGDYLGADKSSGDIMLVIRHTVPFAKDGTIVFDSDRDFDYSQTRFDVYKVDKKEQKLKHLKSLGDRVILLYRRQCFIFSACEFQGFKPNSIIYFEFEDDESSDLGIYNLEDHSIEPYEFPDELMKDETMWPPLFWVSPIL